jgi:hypothetical protein
MVAAQGIFLMPTYGFNLGSSHGSGSSVRIYVKKQVRLDRLNFNQSKMFKIGNVAVASVKNRLALAQGPNDTAAKPLVRRYAIWKTKRGKGNRRNLSLSGDMLRNFQVRTVTENRARAYVTGRSTEKSVWSKAKRPRFMGVENKVKAWAMQKIEPWMVLSPKNRASVMEAARRVLSEMAKGLAIERFLGGR